MLHEEALRDSLQKRDRAIIMLGLAGITVLSWLSTFSIAVGEGHMDMGPAIAAPHTHAGAPLHFVLTFLMWAVMMTAMMLPSASPLIVLFAAVNRAKCNEHGPFVSTGAFLSGYLFAWTVFSALMTLVQWGLQTAALLSPLLVIGSPVLGGAFLFAAGLFQWSSLKHACLTRCRTPLGFLMNEWREGSRGALMMGLRHGIYCIGCCWLLMGLLFVTGVMNLLWMAVITVFVLLEKIIPAGYRVSRISGLLLIAGGIWMAAKGLWS
ncbi:MAG: DUF2182 domain-containing protein [Thermodesulfovibrionales bacterium]